MLGKLKHLAFDLKVRQLLEGFRRRADFIVKVERRGDQALPVWPDQHRTQASEEHGAGDRSNFGSFHTIAQQNESFRPHPVGRQIIRLVEIDAVDLAAGDEGVDLQRLVAVRHGGSHLIRLENDVLAVLDLIALDLGVPFHRIAGLAVDEFAFHPVAGSAIEGVESNPFR